MLQKLLIALCTIFVLSACGGDLDLGPENVPPTNDGGGNGDGDDDDEFEPGEPQLWLSESFAEDTSVETWLQRCAEGCDASAELSWVESERALGISPEWASDEDLLEVYTSIEEIEDMEGAHVGLWVYVTDDYAEDGNLEMRLFLENATGGSAYTRGYPIEGPGWNKLAIWEIQPGTGETEVDEETQEETTDYGSFEWHSTGFVLSDVNTVGVQFSANGKAVDVGGDLWLDNLVLSPGSDFAPLLLDITEGWFTKGAYDVDGDVAADPVYGDGFVSFYVDKPNQQLVTDVAGPGSYGGAEVVFTLSLDQEYLDNADGFQPFGQVFTDTDPDGFADDDEEGGEWGCWTGHGGVEADVEFDVTCVMTDEELFELDDDQYALFGVQSQTANAQGTIRIHRVEIKGAARPASEVIASMSEGWRVSDELLNLTYSDEGVSYSPSDDSQYNQLVYDIAGPIDLSGATYEVVFSVDEDFKAGGRAVQPFAQGNPDFGVGDYNCYVGNASLTAGEDYTATCPALGDAFNFEAEDSGVQIGVQIAGDGANQGTVTIKSMTIFLR